MTPTIEDYTKLFIKVISETNGIGLQDTLELAMISEHAKKNPKIKKALNEFLKLLGAFQQDDVEINTLFQHPVSIGLKNFLKAFPLPYREEHIHLTGSLKGDFVYPRLRPLLNGPHKEIYWKKIKDTYGEDVKIQCIEDVDHLLTLGEGEQFDRYLKILLLPKLVLTDRESHAAAAYHMASSLYYNFNVGFIRLKFTFSRATTDSSEQIPGLEDITEEDVVMGLYEGFMRFKREINAFNFVLSPCFRKEADFFDSERFENKREHFDQQINLILTILDNNPELGPYLSDVDTVGSEKELYRKEHFQEMMFGFRKLQYRGFSIRSHHGETFHTLKKGIQAVDNAMNIWHIDTLEHGLSLGINPNYYYHAIFQTMIDVNSKGLPIENRPHNKLYNELMEMNFRKNIHVRDKLLKGEILTEEEKIKFVKTKFHTAREVEHYQHDVLNRMINKKVSLIALPSSNKRLTGSFKDYKDHPFSWWEKKGVDLGVGTDNYVTLDTDYLQELLILLYTDPKDLKITKLLMVATGEKRRPFLSQLLWQMRNSRKSYQ